MFCSNICRMDWSTRLHFIICDWNVPTFSIDKTQRALKFIG